MASADKTSTEASTAELAAAETAAIQEAITRKPASPAKPTDRDAAIAAAADAELKRQEAVVKAVAKTNADDLPKFGGPMRDPGLGR